MRRAQTSVEYLLLTAGVILVGVIASQAVVSSGTVTHEAIKEELNNIVPADTVPPTTDIVCDGLTCYGKYSKSVNIGFVCRDNLGGSGCAVTHYEVRRAGIGTVASGDCNQIAANCQAVYTLAEPPAGTKYTYTITFYSVDLNGNVESPPHTVTIEIGKAGTGGSALLAKCDVNHAPAWPKPGGSLDITAIATADSLYNAEINISSPVGKTYPCGSTITKVTPCKITGIPLPGAPSTYVLTVSVEGNDSFGNQGVCGSENVVVDGLPPNVSVSDPDPCKWYRADFDVKFHASDPTYSSYIDSWVYTIEDGVAPEYTSGTISLSPAQTHDTVAPVTVGPGKYCSVEGKQTCKVTGEFEDRAGNSGSASEQFSIDYTAPTITATLPAAGWVNQPINVTLKCTDAPSNGAGCKAIYWAFVDPDASCPAPGSGGWQSKTFAPTGCPEQWNITETAIATLDCDLCAKDICYYAEDGAGNISAVGRSTVTNPNGNETDGSYAIDKIPPSCGISLESEPQTVEGGCDTDWKMGGIGGYKYSIVCGDQTNGSGVKTVTISLAGVDCGECTLECTIEKDILSTWPTGGVITCSGTTCTASVSPDTVPIGFDCTVDAPSGSTCVASGISVTAEDWAGNTASFSGGTTMKLDAKPPEVTHGLVSTDPATAVCGSWYKSFTITVTGTDEDATSCNSGVCIFQAFVDNGGASPASQKFSPTASKTINNVKITANSGYEGQVCVTSDFHDAVGGANWTDTQICKNLDNKKPSITVTTDKGTYYVGEHINITATASDGGSGLKNITIVDYGGKTYSCGTKSATYKGYITATCQDAAAGSTTVAAMASDWIGNTNSDEKSVAVRCSGNGDCSCLDKITCSGDTEIDWEGVCNGGKCSGPKKVGSFDCSTLSCSDVVTECTCNDSGCTEKGYHQDPTCLEGSGCACVQGSSFTRSVTSCPT